MKTRSSSPTRKKVVVLLLDLTPLKGYLNPADLPGTDTIDLLTADGEHQAVAADEIKAVYFVDDLNKDYLPERKSFLSRPKLEGLWLRLTFRDRDALGRDRGERAVRDFGSRHPVRPAGSARQLFARLCAALGLTEVKVLGVVGAAKRLARPRLWFLRSRSCLKNRIAVGLPTPGLDGI